MIYSYHYTISELHASLTSVSLTKWMVEWCQLYMALIRIFTDEMAPAYIKGGTKLEGI